MTICDGKQNILKTVKSVISIQGTNLGGGLGLSGNTIVLGGAITNNIVFTGGYEFNFGTHANKITKFETHVSNTVIIEYCGGGNQVSLTLNSSGVLLTNDLSGAKGLVGASDFSANYDNNTYIQKIYTDNRIAGRQLSSLVTNPGAGQDQYRLVYDHATTKFTLVAPASTTFNTSDTQLVFNDGGTLAGNSLLTFVKGTGTLSANNIDLGVSGDSGTSRNITAVGSNSNIEISIIPKGAANIILGITGNQLINLGTASGSGTLRRIGVIGSQSQIDISLEPKGTDGVVYIGSSAEAGAYRYISPQGSVTNINLVVKSKGTGSIILESSDITIGNTVSTGLLRTIFAQGSATDNLHLGIGGKGVNSAVKIGRSTEAATYRYIYPESSLSVAHLVIEGKGGGKAFVNGLASKIVDIGDWNMDTTATKSVSHGVADFKKIRHISVRIRNNSDTFHYPLMMGDVSGNVAGYVASTGSTSISLIRVSGGDFDDPNFNSTGYNRGWVTIYYIP